MHVAAPVSTLQTVTLTLSIPFALPSKTNLLKISKRLEIYVENV